MKLQFEAENENNILFGEDEKVKVYAEVKVIDGCSEDYGYLSMKKAILKEANKKGINTADWLFWYDDQEKFLENDADINTNVTVDIEIKE